MSIVIHRDISGEEITLIDLLLWIAALCVYVGYMVAIFIKYQKNPSSIHLGLNLKARRQWIRFVMCTTGQEILSIQAMRNSIMESSFLGTICSTIAFYILTLALNSFNLNKEILGTKYVILSVVMFGSFMSFAFAIRNYNHVGFLATVKTSPKEINILLDQHNNINKRKKILAVELPHNNHHEVIEMDDLEQPLQTPEEVVKFVTDKVDHHRASLIPNASRLLCGAVIAHFAGLRIFYFSILVALTIIGPVAVIVGSFVLVGGIFCLDHF